MSHKTSQKRQFSVPMVVGIAVVAGLAGFILGTRASDFMASIYTIDQNKGLPDTLNLSSLQAVYSQLRSNYDGKLDANALIDGAKKGLVAAAGDQYTVYFTKSDAQQFSSDLEGTFSGIGAELDTINGQLTITSVLSGTPAQSAGLMAQDKIIQVNGQDASSWSTNKAVSAIRGPQGTTVQLAILRGQNQLSFTIKRATITAPSVTWQETSDNIGIMTISRFASDTTDLATKAAAEFKSKGVKGVVLDLRGDGGGYLTDAQDVASLWLNNREVVQERRGNQVETTLYSGDNPILAGMPTVVLIDSGSASASEILASALHDNSAAKLVGTQSFGKGSVQQLLNFPDGSELKVTTDKWYTPDGKNVFDTHGLQPDISVPISTDDIKNGQDPQKDKAIQILQ